MFDFVAFCSIELILFCRFSFGELSLKEGNKENTPCGRNNFPEIFLKEQLVCLLTVNTWRVDTQKIYLSACD